MRMQNQKGHTINNTFKYDRRSQSMINTLKFEFNVMKYCQASLSNVRKNKKNCYLLYPVSTVDFIQNNMDIYPKAT